MRLKILARAESQYDLHYKMENSNLFIIWIWTKLDDSTTNINPILIFLLKRLMCCNHFIRSFSWKNLNYFFRSEKKKKKSELPNQEKQIEIKYNSKIKGKGQPVISSVLFHKKVRVNLPTHRKKKLKGYFQTKVKKKKKKEG